MTQYSLSFDQKSLSEIAAFAGFPVLLSNEVQNAMSQGGDLILASAQQNATAYFANPTGQLASSLSKLSLSPYEIIISSDSPYAHRRDQGFSGTDSMGRTYNDPPYLFMTNALSENEQAVLQIIDNGVSTALTRLGGA
jgi:hypothetical protein